MIKERCPACGEDNLHEITKEGNKMTLKLTKTEADFLSIVFKNYEISSNSNKENFRKEIQLYHRLGKKINKATSKTYGFTRIF